MLLFDRVKQLLQPVGFARFSFTTAEQAHDEMIAFTSQMAHVVSECYIKEPHGRAQGLFLPGASART